MEALTDPQDDLTAEHDAVDPLLSPYLEALFWRPTRLGVDR